MFPVVAKQIKVVITQYLLPVISLADKILCEREEGRIL